MDAVTVQRQQRNYHGYPARWVVLVLASMSAFCQGCEWNFYSPVSDQFKYLFGWSDDQFALCLNASNIVFVLVTPAWPYLIEQRGLRPALMLTYVLLLLSSLLRCIPISHSDLSRSAPSPHQTNTHYLLVIASMVLNGMAAPCCSLMPPAISAVWFPVGERATATGVMVVAVYFGISAGFIFGPIAIGNAPSSAHVGLQLQTSFLSKLQTLYRVEAAVVAVLLLLTIRFFPNRPPSPPAPSAAIKRTSFLAGIIRLAKSKRFWVLLGAMTIPGSRLYQHSPLHISCS